MKSFKVGVYSQARNILKPESKPVRTVYPEKRGNFSQEGNPEQVTIMKKKSHKKRWTFFVFLVVVILAAALFYDRLQALNSRVTRVDDQGNQIKVEACTNILNPACWTEAFKPQLKQTDDHTNILLIGVDTRTGTSSLMNTDSIIIASFDHKSQKTLMISIPRDFYAYEYHTKINAVYAWTYKKNKDDPYFYLKEEITKITGLQVHYVATVHFEGVIDLVDKLGGIQICPADAVTATYPNDNAKRNSPDQWFYYDFPKGCQTIDGQKALVWSRFRYVRKGPSYYASDFSRARRQQEVISAVKDKLLADDKSISDRANAIWSLYQAVSKNVTVDITFEDILAALSFIDTADRTPLSIVLDPTLGGNSQLIVVESSPATGYIIKAKDSSYKKIQAEIEQIVQFADFYRELPSILVRNMTGDKSLPNDNIALKVKTDTKYYKAFNLLNEGKSSKVFGMHIFDFTGGTKPLSAKYLMSFLGVEKVEDNPEAVGIIRTKKNEDFAIVIGPVEPTPTSGPTVTPSF